MSIGTGAARTIVLSAWAVMFIALWALDEGQRYLGPRTQWVIPFGAITLAAAAVGHGVLAASRRLGSAPLTRSEAVGSVALFLPMLALLLVPEPTLGAQAASKKRTSNSVLMSQVSPSEPTSILARSTEDAPFVDVAVASLSPTEGASLGLRAGSAVRAQGIVLHDSDVPGTFAVARFFVSCCAADALPIVVPIDRGSAALPPEDQWLLVSGKLVRRGTGLVIAATTMKPTAEPESPYLNADNDGAPPSGPGRPGVRVAAPSPVTTAPTPVQPKGGVTPRNHGGFDGKAARVYDTYFKHCKEFTPDALAFPGRARDATEAARKFAGPPREFQPPAFRGCLAGLEADVPTITVRDLIAAMRGAAEEG